MSSGGRVSGRGLWPRLKEWRAARRLRVALREALGVGVRVLTALPSPHGLFFRVDTTSGKMIARVPHQEDATLRAVEVEAWLQQALVPHPKLLHVDHSDALFAHGMMVHEWIEGTPGTEAIRSGIVTERDLFVEVGKLLRRLHAVPVRSFGNTFWLPPTSGHVSYLEQERSPKLSRRLARLRSRRDVNAATLDEVIDLLRYLRSRLRDEGTPLLAHGDLHAGNIVIRHDELFLIDWLNAHGGCWVADFARTRWQQSFEARDALVCGYGEPNAADGSWPALEAYLSLRFQLGLADFFVKTRQWSACRAVLAKLEEQVVGWRGEVGDSHQAFHSSFAIA